MRFLIIATHLERPGLPINTAPDDSLWRRYEEPMQLCAPEQQQQQQHRRRASQRALRHCSLLPPTNTSSDDEQWAPEHYLIRYKPWLVSTRESCPSNDVLNDRPASASCATFRLTFHHQLHYTAVQARIICCSVSPLPQLHRCKQARGSSVSVCHEHDSDHPIKPHATVLLSEFKPNMEHSA